MVRLGVYSRVFLNLTTFRFIGCLECKKAVFAPKSALRLHQTAGVVAGDIIGVLRD
jgi:hypothetical protein